MNIRDYASQFSLCFLSQNIDLSTQFKTRIVKLGYENYCFTTAQELLTHISKETPHLIVIDMASLVMSLDELMENSLKISSEVSFVIIGQDQDLVLLQKYLNYNVVQIIAENSKAYMMQLELTLDMYFSKLLIQYQCEQSFEEIEQLKSHKSVLETTLNQERNLPHVRAYQSRIAEYKVASSKEGLIDLFYEKTPTQSWIYLKYISQIQSFICVSYHEVPPAWIEGLNYKIQSQTSSFLSQLLTGQMPDDLWVYLKKKFNTQHIKFLPLIVKNQIEGLLISTQQISAEVAEDFSLLSLLYNNFVLDTAPQFLDIEDPVTGFYNESFYAKILEREFDRAQRTLTPLSLIKVSIDHYAELEALHGTEALRKILKKLSDSIRATSRLPDYLCRTSENEFTFVLSHCSKKGAVLRAERLREVLQKEALWIGHQRLTLSQGISEYPSLAHSKEDLNESAYKALKFIQEKSGDRICLFKAPSTFKPAFSIEAMS